jgi:hypothetical protein
MRAGTMVQFAKRVARRNIGAARHMAEMAEDNELKARVRGTQSLIARFDQKWTEAAFYIDDGMRYAGARTSHLRLLSGAAQCAAHLGDAERAINYLDQAERERDTVDRDSIEGIFGFPRAKQWHYGGSAHVYLATARIQLHDLDGAMEAVHPFLQLPTERQISWISKGVANLSALLESKYYSKSPKTKEARDELCAYNA